MAERTEILNIQVNYEDALNKIGKFADEIDRAKQDQKLLKEELAQGVITQKEYNSSMEVSTAVVKVNQQSISSLRKEIQNNIKIENEQAGSLKSLRAQLSNTTKAYDEMSKAERTGAKGKELLSHIKELQVEIRGAEEESGRFQRNVGNYQNVFMQAATGGNQFAASMLAGAEAGGGMTGALKGATTQILAMGKAIIANPIGAILAAVVIVIMAFKKAIDSSAEATNTLSRIMAPFQRILDAVLNVLQIVVTTLLNGVEAIMGFYRAVMKLGEAMPLVGKYIKEFNDETERSIELSKEQAKTEEARVKLIEDSAKADRDVAELRAKAEEKQKYTAEERLKFIQEAGKIEEGIAKERLKVAREKLSQEEELASRASNTMEYEEELANLRANVFKEEQSLSDKRRSLLRKENTLATELQNANKAAAQASLAAAKEYTAKREALHKELEDSINNIIEDGFVRQREIAQTAYDRKIAEYNKRKKEEPSLEAEINKLIENQTILFNQQMQKLTTEESNRIAEIERQKLEAAQQRQIEAGKAEQEAARIAMELRQLQLENDIRAAGEDALKVSAIKIAAKQAEIDALQQMDGESAEMFLERQRQLGIDLNELQKEQAENAADQSTARVSAAAEMFGALSDLTAEFADQSEAMAIFSKALALFEIGMNQGVAIAAGVKQAMAIPFPGNLGAIATTVAAIAATITSALKVVKGNETPKATGTQSRSASVSYFSDGGLVTGDGTGTSDSIPAMLSNGESVMTAATTSLFPSLLSSLNQLGGGVPITTGVGLGDMAIQGMQTRQAIDEVISKMPTPVVQVKDITRGITKVNVRDTQRTI